MLAYTPTTPTLLMTLAEDLKKNYKKNSDAKHYIEQLN